jgi:hypothetical protein
MGGEGSGKPKGELLTLDGKELIEGKLSKTDFFNFLGMDLADYSGITMTPEQALAFKNQVVRMTHGVSAAIPLKCYGASCNNWTCVFHSIGTYPLGLPCILEHKMIQTLTKSYMEDIGVDPESLSEMTLVNKLVEADIIDYRANIGLSGARDPEDGTLLKTSIMETEKGSSETVNLHPLLEAKEKANTMRIKILEALATTRREKYKKAAALKTSEDTDASKALSDLRERVMSLVSNSTPEERLKKAEDTIDAEWRDSDL